MQLIELLKYVEETNKDKVDKIIKYSDMIIFLEHLRDQFDIKETDNRIHDVLCKEVLNDFKLVVTKKCNLIKDFIKLNTTESKFR